MQTNTAEILMLVDASGSMGPTWSSVVKSFSDFIREQATLPDPAVVTVGVFNNTYTVLADQVDVRGLNPDLLEAVFPSGGTALLDAVGIALGGAIKAHRLRHVEKQPSTKICVIMTDGLENMSQEMSFDAVKSLVNDAQNTDNWKVIFLGANIDSFNVASRLGISARTTKNYSSSVSGNVAAVNFVNAYVGATRMAPRSVDAQAIVNDLTASAHVEDDSAQRAVHSYRSAVLKK